MKKCSIFLKNALRLYYAENSDFSDLEKSPLQARVNFEKVNPYKVLDLPASFENFKVPHKFPEISKVFCDGVNFLDSPIIDESKNSIPYKELRKVLITNISKDPGILKTLDIKRFFHFSYGRTLVMNNEGLHIPNLKEIDLGSLYTELFYHLIYGAPSFTSDVIESLVPLVNSFRSLLFMSSANFKKLVSIANSYYMTVYELLEEFGHAMPSINDMLRISHGIFYLDNENKVVYMPESCNSNTAGPALFTPDDFVNFINSKNYKNLTYVGNIPYLGGVPCIC